MIKLASPEQGAAQAVDCEERVQVFVAQYATSYLQFLAIQLLGLGELALIFE